MREIELPEICQEGQHSWSEMSSHACGNVDGDQAMDEGIVLSTPAKDAKIGLTCSKCFQILGKPEGVRNQDIVSTYKINLDWDLRSPAVRKPL